MGWFASLFGYNQTADPTIQNPASNGVDVPMNQPKTVMLWDKYGLDFGSPTNASDSTPNQATAADQSWFSSIWQGTKNFGKFVFCPIFTTCPEPLPPGGITVASIGSSAGKAVGDTLSSALSPIMPILIILLVGLVLVNLTMNRVGVK